MRSSAHAASVPASERVEILDVLRGFALFGIFVMNLPTFAFTWWPDKRSEEMWPQWWNVAELFLQRWVFSGKFNSIFSFLFGVGFALQIGRLEKAGGGRAATVTYLRRLGALLLFGLAHQFLLWHGDVLRVYAEIGLVLLLVRGLSSRALLGLAFAALLVSPLHSLLLAALSTPATIAADQARYMELERFGDAAFHGGPYLDAVRYRAMDLYEAYRDWHFLGVTQLLGTALFGFWAARRGVFRAPMEHRALARRVLVGGLVTGVIGNLVWALLRKYWVPGVLSWIDVVRGFGYVVQRPAFALVYISGAFLLWTSGKLRFASRLAYAGRMALTNYLSQSVVGALIFYPFGLGLYGKVGPALCFVLAVVVFAVQVVLSEHILRRFGAGPMEVLWRRMTYGREKAGVRASSTVDGARAFKTT